MRPSKTVSVLAFAMALLVAVDPPAAACGETEASPDSVTAADLVDCDRLLDGYLSAIVAGDTGAAGRFWRTTDRRSAARLEIRYLDAPLKVDGDSPLWLHRADLRTARLACTREPPTAAPGGVRQVVVLAAGPDTVRFAYRFARESGRWRLASPVALALAGAESARSRFVALSDSRAAAPAVAGELAAALLDSCVRDMAARLDLKAGDLDRLSRGKLGYLLTDPAVVALLAGAQTEGVANLQQDVVISSHPCHAHELAHLVLNAWLRELPTRMLPLMQEGVAVQLGGRWGRHRRVLERVGRTALAEGWVTLDDLLTREAFQTLPADLSYAPAGVFAGFILREHGPDGLRAACRAAGAESPAEAGSTAIAADSVRTRLAQALGVAWSHLAESFADHIATPVGSGITPGLGGPMPSDVRRLDGTRLHLAVGRGDDVVSVEATGGGGAPEGAILFGGGDAVLPAGRLFAEHFPGLPCRGESHALIFTVDEVKLYDYRLEMMVALHAEGFWPSTTFHEAGSGRLRFRVDGTLWPAGRPTLVEAGVAPR